MQHSEAAIKYFVATQIDRGNTKVGRVIWGTTMWVQPNFDPKW